MLFTCLTCIRHTHELGVSVEDSFVERLYPLFVIKMQMQLRILSIMQHMVL